MTLTDTIPDSENLVEWIVDTYDLQPRVRDKIVHIARENMPKDFAGIYSDIARLVDSFQVPYQERFATSLDAEIQHEEKSRFSEIIGAEDPDLANIEDRLDPVVDTGITLQEAVSLLDGQMDKDAMSLIQSLMARSESGEGLLGIEAGSVGSLVPEVQHRLGQLAEKFTFDGRILIPPRPIKRIDIDKGIIEFGPRQYNGNPLAYFRANIDWYRGMSRTQLDRFDQGLARSLREHGQMDAAIQEKICGVPLSQDLIEKIVSAHPTYGGTASRVAAEIGCSGYSVTKYWRQHGLDIKPKGNPLNPSQISNLCGAYGVYGGNVSRAAMHLPHGRGQIRKYWVMNGLEVTNRLYEWQVREIVEAHSIFKGNALAASRGLDYSDDTIVKYWRANGLEADGWQNQSSQTLPQKDIDQIIDAHATWNGNSLEASRHLPYAHSTICKYWAESGLDRKGAEDVGLSASQREKIIGAYSTYGGSAQAVAGVLGHSPETVKIYWKAAGLEVDKRGTELDKEEIGRIVAAYDEYEGRLSEAARGLKRAPQTVRKHWVANGLEIRAAGCNDLKPSQIEEITAGYETYSGNLREASRHLSFGRATIGKYWKAAGLIPNGRRGAVANNQ